MPFTPIILLHIATAVDAVILGGLMLALKRGTSLHHRAGRVWVALMLMTTLVSFGIKASGNFSWIHLLSVGMLVTLGCAVISSGMRWVWPNRGKSWKTNTAKPSAMSNARSASLST